jgi:hypothetical protein
MKLAIKPEHKKRYLIAAALVIALVLLVLATRSGKKPEEAATAGPQPSLSVTVEAPLPMRMGQRVSANGNIEAWQEAVIGANVSGLILSEVKVNVGDVVRARPWPPNWNKAAPAPRKPKPPHWRPKPTPSARRRLPIAARSANSN